MSKSRLYDRTSFSYIAVVQLTSEELTIFKDDTHTNLVMQVWLNDLIRQKEQVEKEKKMVVGTIESFANELYFQKAGSNLKLK
jgi:hypothetical protein